MANRTPPPPNKKAVLIAGSVVFIGAAVYMTLIRGWSIYLSAAFAAAGIGYLAFTCGKESRDDKKAAELNGRITDESYFSSSEWREKYLKHSAKHEPETVDPKGMAADLKKRYRAMTNWLITVFGILFAGAGVYLLFAKDGNKLTGVGGVLLGLLIAYIGIEPFLARPVKRLYSSAVDISAVERSYESGRLFTHAKSGISVGREYTVVYNNKNVWAIPNGDISSVDRKIVRVKNYNNSIYSGDEFHHHVRIFADKEYTAELSEFDTETAVDELCRVLNMSRGTEIDETFDNNVS